MLQSLLILLSLLFISSASAQTYGEQGYGNASQLGAEMSRLEEQMRSLRGDNEKLQFRIKQLEESQKRFQEDIEFRLNGSVSSSPTGKPGISAVEEAPAIISPPALPSQEAGTINIPQANIPFETVPETQTLRMPESGNLTPRDLYNQAFRLLNQTDYPGAERSFSQFIGQFPKDPLIGNAWYWLGETHYVRRDYVKAADSFRQGYEALEEGPKAGDNLLKLAMSLSALEKDEEACVVLKQVDSQYSANSKALKGKVTQEKNRLGC